MTLQNVWGSSGAASGSPSTYPRLSSGTSRAWYRPPAQQQRTAAPFERISIPIMDAVTWGIQAQADISERPVAIADIATGGAVSNILKGIGDFGGSVPNQPGPIGQFVNGIMDFMHAVDTGVGAFMNAGDAQLLTAYRDAPMDASIKGRMRNDQGLLGFFGLGETMTKQDFLADLAGRGFNVDPETGQPLSWDDVANIAQTNPFSFGNRLISEDAAVDMGARMIVNPLNLLFLIPGAGWAAGASKVGAGLAAAGRVTQAARWARPVATLTSRGRYGVGYLADMANSGFRATRIPDAVSAGQAILSGHAAAGSVAGLGWALGRGIARIPRTVSGYRALPENAIARMSGVERAMAQTGNVLSAYQRGALRVQLGSVAAEFAAGGFNNAIENSYGLTNGQAWDGHILDAVSEAAYNLFHKINNHHPLSQNEAFVMFSAFAFPTPILAKEQLWTAPREGLRRAMGDQHAVVFAKRLMPEGFQRPNDLFLRMGEGTREMSKRERSRAIEVGRTRFLALMDYMDMRRVYMSTAGFSKAAFSMDEAAMGNVGIIPLIRDGVQRARGDGTFNAKNTYQSFDDMLRYGDRPYEFAFDGEYAIQWWVDHYKMMETFAPRMKEIGDVIIDKARVMTQEMADSMLSYLDTLPPSATMDARTISEIFRRYPALFELPGGKRQDTFFAQLAMQGDAPVEGGRPLAPKEQRIGVSEVRSHMESIRDSLPSDAELFHEARKAEADAPPVEALPEPIARLHTTEQINAARRDATGAVRALGRQQREITATRNAEFDRNGNARRTNADVSYGPNGTRFVRYEFGPQGADTFVAFREGVGMSPDDPIVSIFPDGRIEVQNAAPPRMAPMPTATRLGEHFDGEQVTATNDAIMKAVQMGGRTIRVNHVKPEILDSAYRYNANRGIQAMTTEEAWLRWSSTLAKNGFVEVARAGDYSYFAYIGGNVSGASLLARQTEGFYPAYKPSKRIVSEEAAQRMASRRAYQAEMKIPWDERVAAEPISPEDFVHGSIYKFEEFDQSALGRHPFVGEGVYMSTGQSGVKVTAGYAQFMEGNLYVVKPNPKVRTLNMHVRLPNKVREAFKARLAEEIDKIRLADGSFGGLKRSELDDSPAKQIEAWEIIAPELIRQIDETPTAMDFILDQADFRATSRPFKPKPGTPRYPEGQKSIQQILEDAGFEDNTWPGDAAADILAIEESVSALLRQAAIDVGYGGYRHEGNVFGFDPSVSHEVTVIFDAKDVEIIRRLEVQDTAQVTRARFETFQRANENIKKQIEQKRREIADIDRRASELRTITVEDIAVNTLPADKVQKLRELRSEVYDQMPKYDVSYREGFIYDPADGIISGLNIERNMARHVLYDYGPLSKITGLYDALFGGVSSKRLSAMSRAAVFNLAMPLGVSAKQMDRILVKLNGRVREQAAGSMRVPWFRDIVSLPPHQINTIVRDTVTPETWARIEQRYGRNGFHRLLDEASNEFVRSVDTNVRRGNKVGMLERALREGYRTFQYAPGVGASGRMVHKQFYHIFRFMLDLRWHFLNMVEADLLGLFSSGRTRFSGRTTDISSNALLSHTSLGDLPRGTAEAIPGAVTGPAHAMELFDSGLYLHNANLLPVLMRNFDVKRLDSVNKVLDALPTNDPIIQTLVQRFGMREGDNWAKLLDESMYKMDSKGVHVAFRDEARQIAKQDGWTPEEMQRMTPLIERIANLNQRSYDDLISLYTGNLNRTRVERIMNSYWLYWPISYQIKATKWLADWMFNTTAGKRTNMGTAWFVENRYDEFFTKMSEDPEFARGFEENRDLWFVAGMFLPTTPFDTGVSLSRPTRYITSLLAPNVVAPYLGIDGPEDVLIRILELGPIYSARLFQTVINEAKSEQQQTEPFRPIQPLP